MRLKVPITGTVLDFDPAAAKLDGFGVSGHPDAPVRIDVDLGNVSWRLVAVDLVNDLAEIEVTPGEMVSELRAGGDPMRREDWRSRPASLLEKQGFLSSAVSRVNAHTADPTKRLVKSAGAVAKYTAFQQAKLKIV